MIVKRKDTMNTVLRSNIGIFKTCSTVKSPRDYEKTTLNRFGLNLLVYSGEKCGWR